MTGVKEDFLNCFLKERYNSQPNDKKVFTTHMQHLCHFQSCLCNTVKLLRCRTSAESKGKSPWKINNSSDTTENCMHTCWLTPQTCSKNNEMVLSLRKENVTSRPTASCLRFTPRVLCSWQLEHSRMLGNETAAGTVWTHTHTQSNVQTHTHTHTNWSTLTVSQHSE